jgi:hypothetical protein
LIRGPGRTPVTARRLTDTGNLPGTRRRSNRKRRTPLAPHPPGGGRVSGCTPPRPAARKSGGIRKEGLRPRPRWLRAFAVAGNDRTARQTKVHTSPRQSSKPPRSLHGHTSNEKNHTLRAPTTVFKTARRAETRTTTEASLTHAAPPPNQNLLKSPSRAPLPAPGILTDENASRDILARPRLSSGSIPSSGRAAAARLTCRHRLS